MGFSGVWAGYRCGMMLLALRILKRFLPARDSECTTLIDVQA
jgi:hypothetical protein